jgi:hypothetical protein
MSGLNSTPETAAEFRTDVVAHIESKMDAAIGEMAARVDNKRVRAAAEWFALDRLRDDIRECRLPTDVFQDNEVQTHVVESLPT